MNILLVDDKVPALKQSETVLKRVIPDADINKADDIETAFLLFREKKPDVVFMDIRMAGMDGLSMAREFRKQKPTTNIIMVTAYPQYALDAIKLYISDYILKPVLEEDVRSALLNLRFPVNEKAQGLYIQCFGSFEVFFDGKPVSFRRAKSKELLAILIDQKGIPATNAQLRELLWDHEDDLYKQKNYLSQIVHCLKRLLEEFGCEGILIQKRDFYAIDSEKVSCDYYMALRKDVQALASFTGEYMSQYEWAQQQTGRIRKELGKGDAK